MKASLVALMALACLTSACSDGAIDCGSERAMQSVDGIVRQQVEKGTTNLVRSEDGSRLASNAEVRGALGQAAFALEQVRTASRDPNSSKRFCSATLRMTFPADMVESAERTRQLTQQDNLESLADRNNVERSANRFEAQIEYSVQPTDDGSEVFAELQDADSLFVFASELISSHLINRDASEAQAAQEASLADERRAETLQQQEQDAAVAQQRAETLSQARRDSQLAQQMINTVWQNIPASTRRALLEQQRAWLRMKVADCRVEAASVSTDAQERDVARLRCESRRDQNRANDLRRYVGYETPTYDDSTTSNQMD